MHFKSWETPKVPIFITNAKSLVAETRADSLVNFTSARHLNGILVHRRSWQATTLQLLQRYVPELKQPR